MTRNSSVTVAVLLSTYNGSKHIAPQLKSLAENATPFSLHWLDDYSADHTREAVRQCAHESGLILHECHHSKHLGLPRAFFHLLDHVDADIYLFCDQDDVWQPGKLDSTVISLLDVLSQPALSFTDTLLFEDSRPSVLWSPYDFSPNGQLARAVNSQATFAFLPGGPSAQTQGFTRPLRDLYLRHKDTAYTYAAMHDWWMYDIAIASGRVQLLPDAPKVLYRRHQESFCAGLFRKKGRGPLSVWHRDQLLRRFASRHAKGLILASDTLPKGPGLDRMLNYARLVASVDRRQSPVDAVRLSRLGFMHYAKSMPWTCMCSNA